MMSLKKMIKNKIPGIADLAINTTPIAKIFQGKKETPSIAYLATTNCSYC